MQDDIRSRLLDMEPGNPLWFLNFRLGDQEVLYPVTFMGFINGQGSSDEVIITNPWNDGYADRMQNMDHSKFMTAAYLRKTTTEFVYTCPIDALIYCINMMKCMGFSISSIADFFNINYPNKDDVCCLAEQIFHDRKSYLEDFEYFKKWRKALLT